MIYRLLRQALFAAPPELAHDLALEGLKFGARLGTNRWLCSTREMPVEAMGIRFSNPVGLAAGLDKNGDFIDALAGLGFGFIEIGTVTPRPQAGNPKPRLFRIPEAEAIINRMGFNNKGADHLVAQVEKRRSDSILGINIGKNKDTPNAQAERDYLHCLEKVYPLADYVTVNISSPNTKGLRDLQSVAALQKLLAAIDARRGQLAGTTGRRVPLVVKLAPDIEPNEIPDLAAAIADSGFDGVACTNTTVGRDGVEASRYAGETGGLSGRPLLERANQTLSGFRRHLPQNIALIGLGGITKGRHAADKRRLGADLVQLYTGFIYRGPGLIAECVNAMQAEPQPA